MSHFLQNFFKHTYFQKKFNIDKRKAHFSCLINAGEMTKAEAVKKLDEKLYSETDLDNDINYFTKKWVLAENLLKKS